VSEHAPPKPLPKMPRRVLATAAVCAVLVVLLAAGLAQDGLFAPSADVTEITLVSTDRACLTGPRVDPIGFDVHGGGTVDVGLSLSDPDTNGSCTVRAVTTSAPGFTVAGADLPLTVTPGGVGELDLVIGVPDRAFNGHLTVQLS
jgi:hypothetical protein